MKLGLAVALMAGWMMGPGLFAQTQTPPNKPQKPNPPSQANPFPEDTGNVPILPNGNAPAAAEPPANPAATATLPKGDVDPVRSPDDAQQDLSSDAQGFSSSAAGLDNVTPPPDIDTGTRGKKGRNALPPPEHQETAQEDEKVGSYYLDEKNWKAALSRYESAVVLDPENPDVYWGLGEAQRHLGKLAEAKAAYEKLVEYDPDSKHGKEAKKLLKSPELANAASMAKP
jgi:tetratricopeptide (TPR) repeat protein